MTIPLPPGSELSIEVEPEQPGSVLIVEDDDSLRKLLSKFLTKAGYNVVTAEHGAEGLSVWENSRKSIALVITDLRMPLMSGASMILKMVGQGITTPILVVSAHIEEDAARILAAFASVQFLAKPFALDELLEFVRSVIPQPHEVSAGARDYLDD